MTIKKILVTLTPILAVLLWIPLHLGIACGQEAAVSLPKITPPEVRDGRQEIPLPEIVDDVSMGGGGRYLAMHFKALRKIGIFDVSQLKIAGYVSASDGDTQFAAGATKLIVVSGDSGVVSRWDLATQKRELTQSIDLGGSAGHALLGSASAGPAIVSGVGRNYSGSALQVDMDTLRTKPFVAANNNRGFGMGANLRISADGKVIGCWATGVSPSGLQTYVKTGESWSGYYQHDSAGCLVPSPDGKLIYTWRGVYTNQLRHIGGEPGQGNSIPAVHGPFYLTVANGTDSERRPEKVHLKFEGENRPLAEISGLQPFFRKDRGGAREKLTLDERLFLIPSANLILQLDGGNQKLIAINFDIEKAMRNSDIDFLLVSSRPPLVVKAGDRLTYQIEAKSKSGGVKYSLDAGPSGMSLSPTGLLTWATDATSSTANNVIISVTDKSEQQVFHTFTLTVQGGAAGAAPAVASVPSRIAGTATSAIATTPTQLNGNSQEIKLPGTLNNVVVGGTGRFLLFHLRDLKKIAVLDVSKAKIAGYLPASDDNTNIVAGATKALVFSLSQGVVTRYRLDTLERELSVAIPFTNPIKFMGMGSGSEGPVLLRTSQGTGEIDSCSFHFMDINTLKPIAANWGVGQPHSVYRDYNDILVSTNGESFTVQGIGVLRLDGNTVRSLGANRSFGGGFPTADGKSFLANGQVLNAELRQIGDQSTNFGVAIPSVTGSYFLSFTPRDSYSESNEAGNKGVKLYLMGDNRPLVTIPDLALPDATSGDYSNMLGWNKRVFFIPDAQVIVTVPSSNDRVLLRRFKIDDALEASGVDYLVVASQAPAQAELGKLYVYAMKVKSKRGGIKYTLDASPAGMTVSADGKISWDVPKDLKEDKTNVIVSIRDASGQETFHTFAIEIPELAPKVAVTQPSGASRVRPGFPINFPPTEGRSVGVQVPDKPEDNKLPPRPVFRATMRTWTDNSGRKLTAKFVEVTGKKEVVLQLENGETRKVPLSRLCLDDVYEAVRSDLLRQGAKLNGTP